MTIECYYSTCKYHGSNSGEEGPFCFEEKCRASEAELVFHREARAASAEGAVWYRDAWICDYQGKGEAE